MSGWDVYEARMKTERQAWLDLAKGSIHRKMHASLAKQDVLINGTPQTVAIINRTQLDEKRICALPGETLPHGGIVEFADHHWLVTELDASTEVYQRGLMQRCNYLLRFLNKEGKICERWCIVEDGTKYLIGEKTTSLLTLADARIAVTVGADPDTLALKRGRRFFIDAEDATDSEIYQITKANHFFNTSNNGGVYRFILTEDVVTDADHVGLRIADYTTWKPDRELDSDHKDTTATIEEIVQKETEREETPEDDKKGGWL